MFNLKTILRSTPKDRRDYRDQVREYKKQLKVQAQQEAEFNKNLQYANAQQLAQYNKLKSAYKSAFEAQGKALTADYQKETERALTKQSTDLANYYKKQEVMKRLETESQKVRAISDKLNILGTSILDEIKTNKAKVELAQAKAKKSRGSSSSSRHKTSSYTKYVKPTTSGQKSIAKTLYRSSKATRVSSQKSTLDRLLGR